jgi:hypothetical protein
MKTTFAFIAAALVTGCATAPDQVAAVDCKVHPITTANVAGVRKPSTDSLEQRWAEMQLASSDYRFRNLRQNGYNMNNVEDALRDCNAK